MLVLSIKFLELGLFNQQLITYITIFPQQYHNYIYRYMKLYSFLSISIVRLNSSYLLFPQNQFTSTLYLILKVTQSKLRLRIFKSTILTN